jgi:hypothetical protein
MAREAAAPAGTLFIDNCQDLLMITLRIEATLIRKLPY